MPPARLEPTIPASERSQTHALDRADIGIGVTIIISQNMLIFRAFYLIISQNMLIFRAFYLIISQNMLIFRAFYLIISQNMLIFRAFYLTFSAWTAKVLLVLRNVACRQHRKLYRYLLRTPTYGVPLHYAKLTNSLHNLFCRTGNMTRRSKGVTTSRALSSLHLNLFATSRSVLWPRSKYWQLQAHSGPSYVCLFVCFLLWRCDPTRVMASSFLMFLDHTQRRTTVGRTPLDEWSARRRDLYLTIHNTHNRKTSIPPVGFELTIAAGERPQTYALDCAATGTGTLNV